MEVYDLLAEKRLDNESSIEKAIMDDMSLGEILELNEEINLRLEKVYASNEALPNYNFTVNGELGGQDYGGCQGTNCRLDRVDDLNRFASLWADKIYLHSYFDEHKILQQATVASEHSSREYAFKEHYVGHLKCFNRLKPLVEKGIIVLIAQREVCPICYAEQIYKIDDLHSILDKQVEELADIYREDIHAVLLSDIDRDELDEYYVRLDVPEEIDHHKQIMWISASIPKRLERKFRNSGKNIVLSKRELKELHIPENRIRELQNSVLFSHVLTKGEGLNTSFCTNSHLEVKLLNNMANTEKDIDRNQVLQRELACELPIFAGIPVEYLLEIREKNYEAFLVYRDSIKAAINTYLAQDLNRSEVKELYGDVILPRINTLNSEIKVIKDRARRNLKLDVIVLITCGAFGLLSNTLPAQIPALAASGLSILEIARNISNIVGTPDEVKRNDFYFIWKLSKEEIKGRKIK